MALPIPGSPSVAVADESGLATFTFPPPAGGETYMGTLSVQNAPGSAVFAVLVSGQAVGSWIATNTFGPVTCSDGAGISVSAHGLQPGTQYQCNYVGQLIADGDLGVMPESQTSIVQPPNAVFLGPAFLTATIPQHFQIELDTSWRSIWVVVRDPAAVATLDGEQSGCDYEAFNPPYFSNATFFRFPLVAGMDTTLSLVITSSINAPGWYGADLADVDATIYTASGGEPGMSFYKSLTGAGETASPGDLTQLGGFTVLDVPGDGISLTTNGTAAVNGVTGVNLVSSNGVTNVWGHGGVVVRATGAGGVTLEGGTTGVLICTAAGESFGFFNTPPVIQKTITGMLSAVTDPNAQAVLTSIIAALDGYGLVIDGTT